MSALTKVFVVLVTFLAVALVAVIVPFVANVEDSKQSVADAKQALSKAQAAARHYETQMAQLEEELSVERTQKTSEMLQLKAELSSAVADLADSQAQIKQLQADLVRKDADFSSMVAANKQNSQMIETLRKELNERRSQDVEQKTTIIQQVDRINELTSQNETLVRQVRRYGEQVTASEERIVMLEGMIAKLPPEVREPLMGDQEAEIAHDAAVQIRGAVTRVEQVADGTSVQVNVGKNDGVDVNMRFLIHDDKHDYLGVLVITAVDDRAAAGRVQNIKQGVDITIGDLVLAGPMR